MITDDIRFVIDSHDNMFVLNKPLVCWDIPHLFIEEPVVTRPNKVTGYLIECTGIMEINGATIVVNPEYIRLTGLDHYDGFPIRDVPIGSLCLADNTFKGSWREVINRYGKGEFWSQEWKALHESNALGGYVPIPGNRIVEYSPEYSLYDFML